MVEVAVRDKRLRARVVKPPFVRNGAVKVERRHERRRRSAGSARPTPPPTARCGCARSPSIPDAFTSSAEEEAAKPASALASRLARDPARPHDAVFGAFDGDTLVGLVGLDVDMRAKTRHKGHVFGMAVAASVRARASAASCSRT